MRKRSRSMETSCRVRRPSRGIHSRTRQHAMAQAGVRGEGLRWAVCLLSARACRKGMEVIRCTICLQARNEKNQDKRVTRLAATTGRRLRCKYSFPNGRRSDDCGSLSNARPDGHVQGRFPWAPLVSLQSSDGKGCAAGLRYSGGKHRGNRRIIGRTRDTD